MTSPQVADLLITQPVVERHERHPGDRRPEQGHRVRQMVRSGVQHGRVIPEAAGRVLGEREQFRRGDRAAVGCDSRAVARRSGHLEDHANIHENAILHRTKSRLQERVSEQMQISGSSAVVVGGTGGLGEATVRRLHGAGAKVVVADVADEKGKAL